MNSDAAPISPTMPRSAPFEPSRDARDVVVAPAASTGPTPGERADRNGVFGHLVQEDGDIAGLVAYSIYKQNKLDWLRAFETAKGRAPDEAELSAYIIGEGTPRRLATYRHLAEATLAGNGPDVDAQAEGSGGGPRRRLDPGRLAGSYATGMVALYALIAVLFVVGFYLAMHFTATTR